MSKAKVMPYPEYDHIEVGCKVSWYYYQDPDIAKKASKAAEHNAVIHAMRGYDFGFQCPGEIEETEKGFRVTIP